MSIPGLEGDVVYQAVHKAAPRLHLPAERALDQRLRVVCRPAVESDSLFVVHALEESGWGSRMESRGLLGGNNLAAIGALPNSLLMRRA